MKKNTLKKVLKKNNLDSKVVKKKKNSSPALPERSYMEDDVEVWVQGLGGPTNPGVMGYVVRYPGGKTRLLYLRRHENGRVDICVKKPEGGFDMAYHAVQFEDQELMAAFIKAEVESVPGELMSQTCRNMLKRLDKKRFDLDSFHNFNSNSRGQPYVVVDDRSDAYYCEMLKSKA